MCIRLDCWTFSLKAQNVTHKNAIYAEFLTIETLAESKKRKKLSIFVFVFPDFFSNLTNKMWSFGNCSPTQAQEILRIVTMVSRYCSWLSFIYDKIKH